MAVKIAPDQSQFLPAQALEPLLPLEVAARQLGVLAEYMEKLVADGVIESQGVGPALLVDRDDLLKYKATRDAERQGALRKLAAEVRAAGLYQGEFQGETR